MMALPLLALSLRFASATYCVSPRGRDTNSGSPSAPWRSLQYACDHVPSGARVVVEGGVYNERITVKVPMTLVAAEGAIPVIDGTGIAVPSDDAALVLVKDVDRVVVSGFEIRNFRTKDSGRVPMGVFVAGKADGVALLGNRIHHIENLGAGRDAINGFGIAAYGNSRLGGITGLRIEGNEVSATKTGSSETVALNGNVDGFVVADNWIHDVDNIGIGLIGFEGTSPLKDKDQARNGLVAGNRVENVSSRDNPAYRGSLGADGIYVDGGTGIVIERNLVRAADIGFEVASEHGGKNASRVTVRSNLAILCGLCGLSIGGYEPELGGTVACVFLNNTLVGNDTTRSGMGEVTVQYNVKDATFANNILAASAQGILIATPGGGGTTIGVASDRNLFFAAGRPTWNWKGRTYATLAAFAAATGLDANSRYADPRFVDSAKGDFRLRSDSPARDAGWNFGATLGTLDLGGAVRVQGAGVDAGAYELPPR